MTSANPGPRPDDMENVSPEDTAGEAGQDEQWTRLTDLVRSRADQLEPDRLLRIVLQMVPHAEHAGVTLVRQGRHPTTAASTDRQPVRVDKLQYRLGQGPCLEASQDPEVIISSDLETERRWPRFAAACVAGTPIRSMLSVQLPMADGDRGALNLYACERHAFDTTDVSTAMTASVFVALVIGQELHDRDITHLTTALDSNRTISRAVGILMARRHLTHEEAFQRLQHAGSLTNRKLRDLAEVVEYEGDLPDLPEAAGRNR